MGDFSRDTFRLTNAMHLLLSGEAVADARHYVGVRLQQGVPLLDSDWNELDEMRQKELVLVLKSFIGNGVPSGNQGFRITASGDPNNFTIQSGILMADGQVAINLAMTTYTAQPLAAGLPALTTPPAGPDRLDAVYLDLWHEEVPGEGAGADDRLVNPIIGLETSVRIARRWQVRVREGAEDLEGLPVPSGHAFSFLARLRRRGGTTLISESSIVDRRRRGITMADHLKVPLDLVRGAHHVDSDRFSQMMKNLKTALYARWEEGLLPHASPDTASEAMLFAHLQSLAHTAQSCAVQALARNVSEEDGLRLLADLYRAQKDWLDQLDRLGNVGAAAQAFMDAYDGFLETEAGPAMLALKPALDLEDVISAVLAQEQLNAFLAEAVNTQLEGEVTVQYRALDNFAPMVAGETYVFTFEVTAGFVSPNPQETFNIQVTLPGDFGTAVPDQASMQFTAPSETKTLLVTVNPTGSAASAQLSVQAAAAGNPAIHSTQPPLELVRGAEPPAPGFYFYVGSALDEDGRLPISAAELAQTMGTTIPFRLRNGSAAETLTYQVTRLITPDVSDDTGWDPTTTANLAPITLGPGLQSNVNIQVEGPEAPPPSAGTSGTITTSAVVILVNGSAPAEPQSPITLEIPFIVA